jgi:hypothetical protein
MWMSRCGIVLAFFTFTPGCLISPDASVLDDATAEGGSDAVLDSGPDQPSPDLAAVDQQADLPLPDLPTPDLPVPDLPTPDLPTPDLPPPDMGPPPLGKGNARAVYGISGNKLNVRAWTSTSGAWSAPLALTSPESALWTVNRVSPVTAGLEAAAVFSSKTGATTLRVLERTGASWPVAWTKQGTTTTHADKRGFDLAYEQLSGQILVVYTDGTKTPRYRTKTATGWSAELTLPLNDGTGPNPDPSSGVPIWIELVPRAGANEIALAYVDTNADLVAAVWSGSAWDTSSVSLLESDVKQNPNSLLVHQRAFDLAWETQSGNLLAAWGKHSENYYLSAVMSYIGKKWVKLPSQSAVTGGHEFVDLSSNPVTNQIAAVFLDQGGGAERFGAATWTGSTWSDIKDLDNQARDVNDLAYGDAPAAVAWVGKTGTAVCVYADQLSGRLDWGRWTSTAGWTLEPDLLISGKGETESVLLAAVPGTNQVVALLSDSSTKLWSVVYSGSAWSVGNKGAALAPLLAATNTVSFSLDFQIK